MRNYLVYSIVYILICLCSSCDIWEPSTSSVPASPTNVVFTPTEVRAGDDLVIRFDLYDDGITTKTFEDVTVDANGIIQHTNVDPELFPQYASYTDEQKNSMVEFGIKLLDGAEDDKQYYIQPDGNYTVVYHPEYYERRKIYPEQYIKFALGEIRLIVPDDAISGPIILNFGGGDGDGFSDNNLIVLDASGDEVW